MAKQHRRTHSSIDALPESMRKILTAMIVDGDWPSDFPGIQDDTVCQGKPKYEDLVEYCKYNGFAVSRSAVGRWAKRLSALHLLTEKRELVLSAMAGVTDENASESQRLSVELLTAHAIDLLVGNEDLSPKQMRDLATVFRDCANVSVNSDKYVRSQIEAKAKKATKKIDALGKKKQIDPETLKAIREQVYGIVK